MKNILIDVRALETGHGARGIGYYTLNLVGEMLKSKKFDFTLLAYSKNNPLIKKHPQIKNIILSKPKIHPRFWWIAEQFSTYKIIKKNKPDIFFSPDTNLPIFLPNKIKMVVTIHDLIPLTMKNDYKLPIDRRIENYIKFKTASRAENIITISDHSKKDIVKYLKVDPEKITITYEAVGSEFRSVDEKNKKMIREKFSGGRKYFMIIGDFYGIDPRKSYELIVNAYAKLNSAKKLDKERDPSTSRLRSGRDDTTSPSTFYLLPSTIKDLPILLFVGRSGGKDNEYSRIKEQAQKLGVDDKVLFTDFVKDADLPIIFASAEALLYPSQYEGFGLPILQALSSGCPVVTTQLTSIPEVAGQAASYCRIDNIDSLIRAIDNVIKNRQKYITAGKKQAKKFSWQKCAQQTIDVIKSV